MIGGMEINNQLSFSANYQQFRRKWYHDENRQVFSCSFDFREVAKFGRMNFISIYILNAHSYYIQLLLMWKNLFLDFEPDHHLYLSTLAEPESPTHSDIIMFKQKTQTEGHPQADFDSVHEQVEMQLGGPQNQTGKTRVQAPSLRTEWTKEEEACFFKYLAKNMLNNDDQFAHWSKPNKKGMFKNMQHALKTKDNVQCRLKFNSYKRKHSDRKNKLHFQPSMRSLIMKKLKILSGNDEQSKELMELLEARQIKIEQLKCAARLEIKECKREQKCLEDIIVRLRSHTKQNKIQCLNSPSGVHTIETVQSVKASTGIDFGLDTCLQRLEAERRVQ